MRFHYPKAAMILADAGSVAVAWAFVALATVLGLLSSFGATAAELPFKVAVLGFFSAAAVHVVLAFRHSCPSCGKHPTIQGFRPPHPESIHQSKLGGWSGVVMSVLSKRRFTCIHCGAHYDASRESSSVRADA